MNSENISPNVNRSSQGPVKDIKDLDSEIESSVFNTSELTNSTFQNVPFYESSKSIDENDLKSPAPARKSKSEIEWKLHRDFASADEASSSLDSEKWSRYRKTDTTEGVKVFFRCNQVKLRGPQCAAGIYHLFVNDKDVVLEYRTNSDHTHDYIADDKDNKEKKSILEAEVERLLKLNVKPRRIMQELSERDDIVMPTFQQLTTLIAKIRKKIFGPVTISMTELSDWLQANQTIPEDIHTPFVLCQEVDAECEEPFFRFIISTKYLLGLTKFRNFTHCDTTYKCIWQGFPVFMVGTTDWEKAYQPFGLCVCTYERKADFRFIFQAIKDGTHKILGFEMKQESLVCDAAFAIINGFQEVFGDDIIVIMCWFHAKTAMEDYLKIVNKENRSAILEDIEFLHLSSNSKMFDNAADLFLRKWHGIEPLYCKYFEDEWLIKHRNWFLGAAEFTPCHNNALESSNRYLKDSNTIRLRHPLPHFLKIAMQTVGKWSNDFTIGLRKFATQPNIDLPLWTKGYNWAKANVSTKVIEENDVSLTVEVQAEVVQAKKRQLKDAVVVAESASFQVSNFQPAKKHKIDDTDTDLDVLIKPKENQRKSLSQPTKGTGPQPKSTKSKVDQRRSKKSDQAAVTETIVGYESVSQPTMRTGSQATSTKSKVVQRRSRNSVQVAFTGTDESLSQSTKRVGSQAKSKKSNVDQRRSKKSDQVAVTGTGVEYESVSQSTNGSGSQDKSTISKENDVRFELQSPSSTVSAADGQRSKDKEQQDDFEVYKKSFRSWIVTVVKSKNILYESKCNCPAFLKDYICKHVVGLAIRLKLASAPLEAKTVPIGQKRKRGRPCKTKPALMIQ